MWSDVFPPPLFLSSTSHFGFPDFKGHLDIYFLSWRSGFCFSLLRELWPHVWFCLKVWNTIQSATKERRRETSWVRRFPSRRLDQGGGLRAKNSFQAVRGEKTKSYAAGSSEGPQWPALRRAGETPWLPSKACSLSSDCPGTVSTEFISMPHPTSFHSYPEARRPQENGFPANAQSLESRSKAAKMKQTKRNRRQD